jgi:rod shape-determining protein MreD
MARILFALCLAGAALVQATILPSLDVIEVLPDLTLVLLLVWSALRGTPEGLIWAFGLGLFFDMLALDPLGTNGLALLGVAILGGVSQRRFFHSKLVLPIALAIVATVIHALVLLLFRTGEGAGLPVGSVFRLIILQALLNSICVPPLYVIAGWMARRMDTRRGWA